LGAGELLKDDREMNLSHHQKWPGACPQAFFHKQKPAALVAPETKRAL
jgi:hypothetical protein